MPKIIIANNDNDLMVTDPRARNTEYMSEFRKVAVRMLWFVEPGDILIMPTVIDPAFVQYVERICRFPRDSVTILYPGGDGGPIDRHVLLDDDLVARVKVAMAGSKQWSMLPYISSRAVRTFADRLGIGHLEAVRPYLAEGGAELMNDKRAFRTLASGRGISLAAGTVAFGRMELEEAIEDLVTETGAVIVKQGCHAGGAGNVIVTNRNDAPRIGAEHTFEIGPDGALSAIAARVWDLLGEHERSGLVVERYYSAAFVLTSEFRCIPSKNQVEFLNWGQVRQAPTFSGLAMPPAVAPYVGARFIAGAAEIARLSCDLGFDGLINIDGIATSDGRVIYNEFNGRTGGCSHIHAIAERVAGADYGDRLIAASLTFKSKLCIEDVIRLIETGGLSFSEARGDGVIVSSAQGNGDDWKIELMSIAATFDAILELERRFATLIADEPRLAA